MRGVRFLFANLADGGVAEGEGGHIVEDGCEELFILFRRRVEWGVRNVLDSLLKWARPRRERVLSGMGVVFPICDGRGRVQRSGALEGCEMEEGR